LLATFANQAAISLDNARLYGELQSRLEEMVGLQRLGTLLLEEHDFDRVLRSICQQPQRLTDAGGVGLAPEEDPRFLEMRTVVGPSADALRGTRPHRSRLPPRRSARTDLSAAMTRRTTRGLPQSLRWATPARFCRCR
jgi:hypothetical protein